MNLAQFVTFSQPRISAERSMGVTFDRLSLWHSHKGCTKHNIRQSPVS